MVKLRRWQRLGTPPRAGGQDDQPAGFVDRAETLDAVYELMRHWYQQGSKGFNDRDWKLFKYVLELRRSKSDAGH